MCSIRISRKRKRHGREGTAMAFLKKDKGPERGGRPLSGLTRRGTSQLSDYGVIRRRPLRDVAPNAAFQGKNPLQIGNVAVSVDDIAGGEINRDMSHMLANFIWTPD
jgi:hypothetical protein